MARAVGAVAEVHAGQLGAAEEAAVVGARTVALPPSFVLLHGNFQRFLHSSVIYYSISVALLRCVLGAKRRKEYGYEELMVIGDDAKWCAEQRGRSTKAIKRQRRKGRETGVQVRGVCFKARRGITIHVQILIGISYACK